MNKEAILLKAKNNKLKTMKVFINDWKCDVIVKQLSGKQFMNISLNVTENDIVDRAKFLNHSIIETTYDINNVKIFEINDIELVENMSADGYSSLITAITVLNNLGGEDKKKSKNSK